MAKQTRINLLEPKINELILLLGHGCYYVGPCEMMFYKNNNFLAYVNMISAA
jgi:hypothetical protein